jgi:hypothetical protein
MLTSLSGFGGKGRSFAYSFRTGYRAGRPAQGRLDPFADLSANDRYLRSPAGWSRRIPLKN